jgi:hypothetical protein
MPSEMLRTSISLVTASLVATSLVGTSLLATAIGTHAAAAENARRARHAYPVHASAGRGYAARTYAGRTYTGPGRGPWLARRATLPHGPEYGFLRNIPANAIVGPGYVFVPGVGILGESCDLPTSACTNEYRDVR